MIARGWIVPNAWIRESYREKKGIDYRFLIRLRGKFQVDHTKKISSWRSMALFWWSTEQNEIAKNILFISRISTY